LEEEEVRDVGEVGLPGVEHALEDAEVDEGCGFEDGSDAFRIPRSCAEGGRSCADGEGLAEGYSRFPKGMTERKATTSARRRPLHFVAAHFVVVEAF
jgi:hypothetical protein